MSTKDNDKILGELGIVRIKDKKKIIEILRRSKLSVLNEHLIHSSDNKFKSFK